MEYSQGKCRKSMSWTMDIIGNETSRERTFLGVNTLENESSRAQKGNYLD